MCRIKPYVFVCNGHITIGLFMWILPSIHNLKLLRIATQTYLQVSDKCQWQWLFQVSKVGIIFLPTAGLIYMYSTLTLSWLSNQSYYSLLVLLPMERAMIKKRTYLKTRYRGDTKTLHNTGSFRTHSAMRTH